MNNERRMDLLFHIKMWNIKSTYVTPHLHIDIF